MLPLGISFTFMEWVQTYGPEAGLPPKQRPNALLEDALCKYFRANKKKVLEIQHRYMCMGWGKDIGLVRATEYAIENDIEDPSSNIQGLNPLESAIQLVLAMEKVSRLKGIKSPFDERRVVQIMRARSKEFRQEENYQETMWLYMGVAERYSKRLQRCFHKIRDKSA